MCEDNRKQQQYQVDGRKYENLAVSIDGSLVAGICDYILTIWKTTTGETEEIVDLSSLLPLSMRRRGEWKIYFSSKATYLILSFKRESYSDNYRRGSLSYSITAFYWIWNLDTKKVVYQSNANIYEDLDSDFLPSSVISDNEQWFVYWGDVLDEYGDSWGTDTHIVNLQTGKVQSLTNYWHDFAAIANNGILVTPSINRGIDCFFESYDCKKSLSPNCLPFYFEVYGDFDWLRYKGKYRMEINEKERFVSFAVVDTEENSVRTIFTGLTDIKLYLFDDKYPNIAGAVSKERLKIWSLETTECLYDFVIKQSNDYSVSVTNDGVFIEHPTKSASKLFFLN